MKIRGTRECKRCGARWSYYETGTVECPECGGLRSVGIDEERRRHTDSPSTLDLSAFRTRFADEPISRFADDLKRTLREYVRKRGFIDGGELRELDETYLAARELLHAVDVLGRRRDTDDDEELYLLRLLRTADRGERPATDEVPPSMIEARGIAYAEAVDAYRRDLLGWLEDRPDPEARRTLGTVRDQIKRAEALQGSISPETSEQLVAAAREVGRYLREGDSDALASARDRLARLG